MGNTIHIAESAADETFSAQPSIMAGDTPPVATRDLLIVAAVAALPQYTPLSFATGAYKVWAAGEDIVAMTAYAVPDSASDQRAACFTAGMFNIDAVNWPEGTTEDEVAAATINSQLQFRKLLYSDKRVDLSGLEVGPDFEAPTTG